MLTVEWLGVPTCTTLFNNQNLYSIEWYFENFDHSNFEALPSRQQLLKSLKLIGKVGYRLMNTITNKLLDTLTIDVSEMDETAKKLSKLTGLTSIFITNSRDSIPFTTLIEGWKSCGRSLTALDIKYSKEMPMNVIADFANPFPNIRSLSFDGTHNTSNGMIKFFNLVEVLHFCRTYFNGVVIHSMVQSVII